MAGWKVLALNRVELLEDEVRSLALAEPKTSELQREVDRIRDKHHLENGGVGSGGLAALVGGDEVNHTWDELHRLEVRIEKLKSSAEVVGDARRHAAAELSADRQRKLEQDLEAGDSAAKKAVAVRAIRESHAASAVKREGERQRNRGIFLLSAFLVLVAVVTVLLQWRAFPDRPIIAAPSDATSVSAWTTLIVVMVLGSLGGGFSALLSLYVNNPSADTYWFDPRPTLTFMKIAVGIWTAVLGVVGLGEGLLTGTYASFTSLVVLAFVLGYGQQAVTSLLDKRVEALASQSKS